MLSQSTKSLRAVAKQPPTGFVSDGTRFLKDGHWWEVDDHISGKEGPYYRCHPVCNIESRFFTHNEVSQAISQEKTVLPMGQKPSGPQNSVGRGSGRKGQLISLSQAQARRSAQLQAAPAPAAQKVQPVCKLLAIGSRDSIQQTIQHLHSLGFAHVTDWSPVQRKPKSPEFMSIFTGHQS